ncbi:MAG: cupin-like domain-containing protein [Myxococcales bacterium]|nr:cupin-like domain-containing protein [Myxococcales bacterium]
MTNTIEHWPALGKWSVAYFRDCFAERLVRVRVQPDRVDPETWIRHCANYRDMRFGDFLDRIDAEVGNRHYMAHSALLAMIPALQADIGSFPYLGPVSASLGRFPRNFIRMFQWNAWLGPRSTVTPLHFAPTTDNFVVQIFGEKEFFIYPPEQASFCYLPSRLELPHMSPVDHEQPDLERFPSFASARPTRLVLKPGDALYIPPGWPHHVRSLSASLTLNFWRAQPIGSARAHPPDEYARYMLGDLRESTLEFYRWATRGPTTVISPRR